MFKKVAALVFALCFAALTLAACSNGSGSSSAASGGGSTSDAGSSASGGSAGGGEGGFTIGFLNNYVGNTWRGQFVEGVETICEEYKAAGILADYQIASSNDDVTSQLNQMNQMISQDMDALVVDPVSPTAIGPAVEKALEAGIIVVICNDAAAYEGTYFIGNNQDAYARIGMDWVAHKMKEAGKENLIFFEGLAGNATEVSRNAAAQDVLANNPDINVLGQAPNSWSMTETQAAMATFLSTYDNIDAVYAPEGLEGVYRAYENTSKELPIMNTDYSYSALQYCKDNNMDTTTTPSSPAIGANGINFAVKLLQGMEVDESLLEPNPLDENLKNFINLNPPYTVVGNEEDKSLPFLEGYEGMKLLTLDEALELCEGKPSTYMLDMPATDEYISSFFK